MAIYDPNEIIYICDPEKNKGCRKGACFVNYGPCRFTKSKRYAKTDESGKALGYTAVKFKNLDRYYKDISEWPEPDRID